MHKVVRFACGDKPLRTVLAAVLMGDDQMRLHRDLAYIVHQATLIEDAQALAKALAKVVAAVKAPGDECNVPLDMHGSDIEIAVWQALRPILAGETRRYGQIARTLPAIATAQEVGAACTASVLAVVVPCRRVAKADGSISGHRWSVSRKGRLLAMERGT